MKTIDLSSILFFVQDKNSVNEQQEVLNKITENLTKITENLTNAEKLSLSKVLDFVQERTEAK